MITIVCDGCQNRFEASDAAAGTTVACPKCGAANGVPGGRSGVPPAPAGEAADSDGGLIPGERRLRLFRTAMFRARPGRFVLFLLLALGGIGGAVYFAVQRQDNQLAALCAAGSLLGIVPLIVWKFATLGASLEVTSRRTISRRGILRKLTNEVQHRDVKNIQIDQTFQERIFNVGTVGISSAGQEGIEIVAKSIPHPYTVRELIDRNRG